MRTVAPQSNDNRPQAAAAAASRAVTLTVTLGSLFFMVMAAAAHHGSAEYHVDREVAVTGVVREWRWTQPHTWVHLTVAPPDGAAATWEGEGPPLSWAEARGWSKTTLRPGERVTVVMYPSRRQRASGLVKRIERANGEVLVVSRPWLER